MIGRVISTKTKNTATVLVEREARHPLYKKTFIRSKKYLADDQIGVKEGDIVEIIKIRPVSNRKHWRTVKVLGRSFKEIAEKHLKEKAEEVIAEVMPAEPEKSENQSVSVSAEQTKSEKSDKSEKKKRIQKEIK